MWRCCEASTPGPLAAGPSHPTTAPAAPLPILTLLPVASSKEFSARARRGCGERATQQADTAVREQRTGAVVQRQRDLQQSVIRPPGKPYGPQHQKLKGVWLLLLLLLLRVGSRVLLLLLHGLPPLTPSAAVP